MHQDGEGAAEVLLAERVDQQERLAVAGGDAGVDGRSFLGGWGPLPGPWLKPGFDEKLFNNLAQNTAMMVVLIDRFNDMLQKLVQEPGFENVLYVDLRGTLSNDLTNDLYKKSWANELHPTGGELLQSGDGFAAVAAKFQAELLKLPTA